jgi:hypothetical protein
MLEQEPGRVTDTSCCLLLYGTGGQEQGGRQGQSQQQMLNQQAKMMAAQWGNAWGVPPGTSGAKAPAAHEQYGGWS